MTAADVPALVEKTRDLMIDALQEISMPSPPGSQAPSPTPLLQAERGTGYQSTASSDEAVVEATIGGNEVRRSVSVDGAGLQGGKKGKKYTIA
jgi:hypothetical protein